MEQVTIEMHGVRLSLRSATVELPRYVARHFAGLQVNDSEAQIDVLVHWSEGDADPHELLPGPLVQQVGKRLYAGPGVLLWSDLARVGNLSLRFELQGECLWVEAVYRYAPRTDKAAQPDHRYKKLFELMSWLVLNPLTWYLERFRGLQLLHASGIAWDKRGVLIAGLGGVGKTTTSVALLAHGARLVSENLVFHDDEFVYSCYEPIRLTAASVDLLDALPMLQQADIPEGAKSKNLFHVVGSQRVDSVAAAAVFLPRFTAANSVQALGVDDCLERLQASNQLAQEVNDYYYFDAALSLVWPVQEKWRRRSATLRALLQRSRCYELGIDRRRGVEPVVQMVLQHIAGDPATTGPFGSTRASRKSHDDGVRARRLRILYVCSDFGVPVYGHKGASVHLRSMATALVERGHEVCIVSPNAEAHGNLDFGVPVRHLPLPQADSEVMRELRRVDRQLGRLESGHESRLGLEVRNLLYNRTVASGGCIADFAPDLVYERYALFAQGGQELARRLGVPHVLEVNAPLAVEQERNRGLQLRECAARIERHVWSRADAVLVVSDALRRLALQVGVAEERVYVVPNAVEPRCFELSPTVRPRVRREYGFGAEPVVGFVGSLKAWHGMEVLLRAFAPLLREGRDVSLLCVGDGPMREVLEHESLQLGIDARVRFTGAIDHARVPEMLAAVDVAVAPYLSCDDFYFSPLKVYEYMAAGRPVVASSIGQIGELVDAGLVSGTIPDDVDSLASELRRVLDDPDSVRAQAVRARDWVLSERTWEANARRLEGLCTLLGV